MEELHKKLVKRHAWYAGWHLNPRSALYHWFIFLSIAFLIFAFFYAYFQSMNDSYESPIETTTTNTNSSTIEEFSEEKMEQGQLEPPPPPSDNVKGISTQGVLAAATPVITIAAPTANLQVDKNAFQIAATATSPEGIGQIQIYLDSKLIKSCPNSPACSTWYNMGSSTPGGHTVMLKAVSASTATTAQKSVTVCKVGGTCTATTNPTPTQIPTQPQPTTGTVDATPPQITIVAPTNNARIIQPSFTIEAKASDASGIANIKIYVDSSLRATCTATTCSYVWPAGSVTNGNHTIKVTATDKATPVANTASTTITVINSQTTPLPTQPPANAPTPPGTTTTPGANLPRPAIIGKENGAKFVKQMTEALDKIQRYDPKSYNDLLKYVTQITEGPQNYSWGGSHGIQIHSYHLDPAYGAGVGNVWTDFDTGSIIHEMTHVKNWFTNYFPVYGCNGEAKSLKAQAAFLDLIGDKADADYIRSYIGNWC